MKTKDLRTGYFADPENPAADFPPVHAITPETTPLCGEDVVPGETYHFCSAHLEMSYLDCVACCNAVQLLWSAEQLPARMLERLLG